MARSTALTEPLRKTRYNTTLLFCLFTGLSICFTTLKFLPSNPEDIGSARDKIVLAVLRVFISICMFISVIYVICMIRKKDEYHRNNKVFWPRLCHHCECVVNLKQNVPCGSNHDAPKQDIEPPLHSTSGTSGHSSEKSHIDMVQQTPIHCNPHMSLLNSFYVFGTIAIINVPLQLIGIVIWLFENCYSSVDCFGVATQGLKDISFIAIILFGMTFFTTYYHALFIEEPKFSYPLGVLVISSGYMVFGKFVSPVGEILGNPINQPGFLWRLNGTFGNFLVWHERILTPFYAECGIIAAGVTWHIWTSIYPRSYFNITTPISPSGNIITFPFSSCRKRIKFKCLRHFRKSTSNSSETQKLIGHISGIKSFQPLIRKMLLIYLVLCASSFGLNQFILHTESIKLLKSEKEYIKWCTEIACSLPVLALCHYQMFVSKSKKSFYPKARVSHFSGLLESHDRVLLLSCVGIFTIAFFRLFGAIGIFTLKSVTGDEIALACFTIIYSIFKIYCVWLMTSFLVTVQRQLLQYPQEIKWTLVTLSCSVVLNFYLWLQESIDLDSWEELKMFYGHTVGKLIGTLLEPVSTLYGLHAAMVAYEAYKDISSDDELSAVQNETQQSDPISKAT